MLLLLALAPLLLPEFLGTQRTRFDSVSAALSLAAILPAVYGLKEWAANGFTVVRLSCLLAGVCFGALFVRRQRLVPDTVLDPSLFARRAFTASVAAQLLAMFALVGNAVFVTQYLQSVLGMSPFVAALWSLAPAILVGGAAPGAAALAPKLGPAAVVSAGFTIAAAGFALLATVDVHGLIPALIGTGLLGAGLVIVMTLVTDLAVGAVPAERAGVAAAVLETGGELGGALGIAILGSIGAAVYHHRIDSSVPADLSAQTAHTIHETLGGALGVAARLPSAIGDPLRAAARSAFTDGLDTVATVGAVIMIVAAVTCGLLLRARDVSGPPSAPSAEPPGARSGGPRSPAAPPVPNA